MVSKCRLVNRTYLLLSPEKQLHLTVAQGFMELSMFLEADTALDDIDPFCRHLPEMLAVRVYQALEPWELMQVVAIAMRWTCHHF